MLAYIGPESVVPLLSVAAAVAGFLLMLGRHALSPFVSLFRMIVKRGNSLEHGQPEDD